MSFLKDIPLIGRAVNFVEKHIPIVGDAVQLADDVVGDFGSSGGQRRGPNSVFSEAQQLVNDAKQKGHNISFTVGRGSSSSSIFSQYNDQSLSNEASQVMKDAQAQGLAISFTENDSSNADASSQQQSSSSGGGSSSGQSDSGGGSGILGFVGKAVDFIKDLF